MSFGKGKEKIAVMAIGAALIASNTVMVSNALAEESLTESLVSGKFSANERLRYESVNDDAFASKAEALTLRSRVGYETAPYYDFTILTEFENVAIVGGMDEYQLPAPPVPSALGDAVIADEKGSEFNRFVLRYRGINKLNLALGRQYLTYDNQRWIGNVGFRQDDQTFDAFSAEYKGIDDVIINYAYVSGVHGIAPEFDSKASDNLFNISYNVFAWGKFVAYSYGLHSQNDSLRGPAGNIDVNPALRYISNETVGLRFDGGYNLPTTVPLRAIYRAEYAQQEAEIMEPVAKKHSEQTTYKADYQLAELGLTWGVGGGSFALTPLIGYEVLGSDDGRYGLQTPYATKHAFNGWADQFLVTPKEGLVDEYALLGFDWNTYAVKTSLQYHEYTSDKENLKRNDNLDFGKETSFQVLKTFGPQWTIGTKYSVYEQADDLKDTLASGKRDTTKLWAWVEYNY